MQAIFGKGSGPVFWRNLGRFTACKLGRAAEDSASCGGSAENDRLVSVRVASRTCRLGGRQ